MTRIKICGITRPEDMDAAVAAGADAVGLVFYPPSPRCVSLDAAAVLAARTPPFVSRVALFVNPSRDEVLEVLGRVPVDVLQFHGDEDEAFCAGFQRPYLKAARVRPGLDLLEFARSFRSAQGLLLDAFVDGYGGAGKSFDWQLVPRRMPLPVILSGGLDVNNVAAGIATLQPWAVDVSSGVEVTKGIKDAAKMAAFVAAVKRADAKPALSIS